LSAGHPEGVLKAGRVEAIQGAGGCCGGVSAENDTRVPAAGDHFQAVQRLAHAWACLIPEDRAEQELRPRHLAHVRRGREHRRYHQRVAVQRRQRVVIVELEPLDEA
jgi:hypothetical protein